MGRLTASEPLTQVSVGRWITSGSLMVRTLAREWQMGRFEYCSRHNIPFASNYLHFLSPICRCWINMLFIRIPHSHTPKHLSSGHVSYTVICTILFDVDNK